MSAISFDKLLERPFRLLMTEAGGVTSEELTAGPALVSSRTFNLFNNIGRGGVGGGSAFCVVSAVVHGCVLVIRSDVRIACVQLQNGEC